MASLSQFGQREGRPGGLRFGGARQNLRQFSTARVSLVAVPASTARPLRARIEGGVALQLSAVAWILVVGLNHPAQQQQQQQEQGALVRHSFDSTPPAVAAIAHS